jgi:L-threonylcarbamoyladenylate synthase
MRNQIREAAALIRQGRLVAFPTETVYGLGANALDATAVGRIYEAKGRPPASPLIVHVASREQAQGLVRVWPREAEFLAERFWPGPLTLVLEKRPSIPDIVTAGLDTVGVRMPAHPVALDLIREAGVPIAAPSANPFSALSPTEAEHVRRRLEGVVDYVLDGGSTEVGIESTVLSLAGGRRTLLRPGMVTVTEIEELIGPLQVAGKVGDAHPSPGLHKKHYSPTTPLILVEKGTLPDRGRGAYLWMRFPAEAAREVAMPSRPKEYAAKLYSVLHEVDGEGWDWIAVESPPDGAAWEAILDRLKRAAG